mgnify:CR=1 FL=1
MDDEYDGIWKKNKGIRDNAKQGQGGEDIFAYQKGLESEEQVKKTRTPDFTTGKESDEVKEGWSAKESPAQKKFGEENPEKYTLYRHNSPENILDRDVFKKFGKEGRCPNCGRISCICE